MPSAGSLSIALLVAAALALLIATRAPLPTTVLGLILFGVLHNVLEIRYVAGRFAAILRGRFLGLLLILTTGIVACRLAAAGWPGPARYGEIVVAFVILAAGAWYGLRGPLLAAAVLILAVGLAAAVALPGYFFVILTHLHNLVPLFFLWEWARRFDRAGARLTFRLAQLLWVVVLPLTILAGAADRWISISPGVVERFVGDGSRVILGTAPPGLADIVGVRFLVMFAFLQTMHYLVWVVFLPRYAPDATAAFGTRVPWLRGGRAWAVGIGGGAFLAVLFVTDYAQGRALYGAIATYHAYLEFPVLLALLMGARLGAPPLPPR